MITRIDRVMSELKAAGKKGIFIYITAGAPDMKTTLEAVKKAEAAGANVIELGLPFSDPMADGPVIQTASVVALKNGMTLAKEMELVRDIRKFSDIPIIGMGYINNMYHYGFERFVKDFKAAGMDGVIVPDVPHEESGDMRRICAENNFILAEFITPGTTEARMEETCKGATGFIYCVSNNGVTGVKKVDYSTIGKVCDKARNFTNTPLAVGFGIGSPEAAVAAAAHADAVIVGSAVVKQLLAGEMDEAMQLISDMRQALDSSYKD
ncbi:MAG: tryptophan synthase subunit alpha [Selenomonas sp.]|nr:tryptophan synthase subunit alpha [Selenomonadales bacterium]MDD7763452.1 tryptophan synthase subunit alpha [Selenomonadales bacterium]MDY5716184.1 tryptophan synthase subunit alpha [Selenomonas sp.]